MNLFKKSIYALSLVSLMGLWSCSQEDMVQGSDVTAKGHSVPVTITVSRGEAQSRTVLSENTDGTLNDIWKDGDKLAVYSADGKIQHGYITIISGQDTPVGVFSGTLENVSNGEEDYYLWYSDPNNDRITVDKDSYNVYRYNVNYNEQGYATITKLSAMDLLNQKIRLSVKGNSATVVKDYTMQAKLPLVHFTLGGDLVGATGTLKIYDDNRSVKCPVTRGYMRVTSMNDQNSYPGAHDDSYTFLSAKVNNGEVYLAMQPTYSENSKVKLRFEFEKDGKTYHYSFENTTALMPGYYYSTVLNLVKEEEPEVVDHSKNPLAKWAESDLMMTDGTSGANATSKFTGNYGTTGDYYQFGRNVGWMNYTKINGSNYSSNTAVAKINDNWAGGGTRKTSFYCAEYGTSVNTTYMYNPYRGQGDVITTSWYNGTSTIKNFPGRFLFAGNESLEHFDGDYVFDTEIRHKQDWATRAKYCGYNNDICPEGYRLPKLEDWKKILPKGGHTYEGSDFSDVSEIKTDGDVTYAIRWHRAPGNNGNQFLRIDALVVPSSTTSTENVDWTDSNVVTRFFKGAGAIKPSFFLAKLGNSYQWVAMAQPLCEFSYDYNTVWTGSSYAAVTKVNITRDDTRLGGYYWVDEPQQYAMGFRFDASNVQQQGSWINVFRFRQPYACNIRCIKK